MSRLVTYAVQKRQAMKTNHYYDWDPGRIYYLCKVNL